MTMEVELVLPPDLEMVPVASLAEDARAKFESDQGDVAITRRRSRTPSRIIDAESAALLEHFRTPTRVVDAVLSFALERQVDAGDLLKAAYPLLAALRASELLLPAEGDGLEHLTRASQIGRCVEGTRLMRQVQVLDDTEVYIGRDGAGRWAAVKFCRTATGAQSLEHEAAILRTLDGTEIAPTVRALAPFEDGAVLVTEWVLGLDAGTFASGLRGRRQRRSDDELLGLCTRVVETYADLHAMGVLHGDVHPRNVLVEPTGRVRLIDFGLAQRIDALPERVSRGGVPFYFDPEFASAQLAGREALLSERGEQYSLGALLYLLWTGVHYIDWRLERGELLRQVTDAPPVPFSARGLADWPELENAVQTALQKRPELRFDSVRALARTLSDLQREGTGTVDASSGSSPSRGLPMKPLEWRQLLERYSPTGDAIRSAGNRAPSASVMYGAAGVAFALYRLARLRRDARLLSWADMWIEKARYLSTAKTAFHSVEDGVQREVVGESSLFHSPSGIHCIRALVGSAYGDFDSVSDAISSFIEASRRPSSGVDATLGLGSLLLGCCELIETIPPAPLGGVRDKLFARGQEIAQDLSSLISDEPFARSVQITSLGAAHGWAGVLYATLRWSRACDLSVSPDVWRGVRELSSLAQPHAGGLCCPVHNELKQHVFMEGWCNGAAGHALLFALAHSMCPSESFAAALDLAAESAWGTELQIGTLCCGLGGVGYAMLAAHRTMGGERWLGRARSVAVRALGDDSANEWRDSLYKGSLGAILLAADVETPESAAMPLFEPWP